jgi:hypothetical protein
LPDWHTPQSASDGNTGNVRSNADFTCDRPHRQGEIITPAQQLVHADNGRTRIIHPFKAVRVNTGIYANTNIRSEHQSVLNHLLGRSPLWHEVIGSLFDTCYAHNSERRYDWNTMQSEMMANSIYMLGRDGMEMLVQTWAKSNGDSTARTRSDSGWKTMQRWEKMLENIPGHGAPTMIGQVPVWEFPFLLADVRATSSDRA